MSDAAGAVASDPAPVVPVQTDPSEYRIVSGDILSVAVYQVPDLNRDAQVDAAGYIVLPLIRGVPVAGRTVRDVEGQLTDRLRAKYIQNPQVTVAVKDAVGARVSVQGAVREPGIIPVRGEVTLTAILAQAKGFTETADRSSVVVIRNTAQGRVAARVDAAAILSGVGPGSENLSRRCRHGGGFAAAHFNQGRPVGAHRRRGDQVPGAGRMKALQRAGRRPFPETSQ